MESAIEISEDVNAAHAHTLPNLELDGLWENLFYESNIKEEAIRYVGTITINDSSVSESIIRCFLLF